MANGLRRALVVVEMRMYDKASWFTRRDQRSLNETIKVKGCPNKGNKDWFACLYSVWIAETGYRQGVGDGVRVAVEM